MRLVLFDIDGTLIRGRDWGRRSLEEAFAEIFSLAEVPRSRGRVNFNGAVDVRIQADMAEWLGIPLAGLARWRGDLETAYLRRLRESEAKADASRVLPGVRTLLERIEAEPGLALGLLTGNIEPAARIKLDTHGLNRYFATGGFGSDADSRVAVARIARQRVEDSLGRRVEAAQVVVVGDSLEDIRCARANGFVSMAVGSGFSPLSTLAEERPDHLLADLAETEAVMGWLRRSSPADAG